MINLTLTENETEVIVNSLHDKLETLNAEDEGYDYLSMTYHTIYDMVRQQQRSKSNA